MDAALASTQNLVQSSVEMQDAPRNETPAVPQSPQLGSTVESLWSLDFVGMFNSGKPGDTNILERRAMLLYSPHDHSQEVELITRWLLMHDVKVNLWYDGAWSISEEDAAREEPAVIIVSLSIQLVACIITEAGAPRIRGLH